jgi:pimeloyl-ACP methyl ester carboxylesterase
MTVHMLRENLIQIPFEGNHMAGILTIPPNPNGHSILIPWGAGAYPSSGRNRLRARFARYMAERGYHALRFDYTGVGESTGEYRRGNLKHPYSDEIRVAARWLVDAAPDHLMVVANCFGAWSTLTAASDLPPTEAICLINSPLGRDHFDLRADEVSRVSPMDALRRVTLEKLRSPAHRRLYRKAVVAKIVRVFGSSPVASESYPYMTGLDELIERGTQVLLLYGDDDFRRDLDFMMERGLHERLEGEKSVKVVCVPEHLRGCSALSAQDVMFDHIAPWLDEVSCRTVVRS